jgi:hypothetical protein
MPAESIDEVLAQLDEIIFRARQERSRLGFFATLYRNVTLKVKEGIASGRFDNGPRLERLDVTFANRYLAAIHDFYHGAQTTHCWFVSFQTAHAWWPLIIQQLLLGMNAHINFDLGVAAAAVAPGAELPALQHDFDEINNILSSMILKVRDDIEQLSPWIKLLDRIDPKTEDKIVNFSLSRARACARNVAVRVNRLLPTDQVRELNRLDFEVAQLAQLLRRPPGTSANIALSLIRLRERNDIPHIIDVLSQI